MSWGFRYREYVPVSRKLALGRSFASKIAKRQGRDVQPVSIQGARIAKTFWGEAWCDHLESYSDFANRLPRGRTYVRNGSVVDLQISAGRVEAIVAGSEPYTVTVKVARLNSTDWKKIRSDCAASIDSILDLLGGRLSDGVMRRLTDRSSGLFPIPAQINMSCSCPDWAKVCKHVAAVLYGVGAHLDQRPELLFLLRGVDQHELVNEAVSEGNLTNAFGGTATDLAGEDLEALFGIELDNEATPRPKGRSSQKSRSTAKKSVGKRSSITKASPSKAAEATTAKIKSKPRAGKAVKKTATKKASVKNPAGAKKPAKKQASVGTGPPTGRQR